MALDIYDHDTLIVSLAGDPPAAALAIRGGRADRFVLSNGDERIEGSVGKSRADIIFNTTDIEAGQEVTIMSLTALSA